MPALRDIPVAGADFGRPALLDRGNQVRAPVRPLRGRWPAVLERWLARFFWPDPTVVLEDDPDPGAFRDAMNAVSVGGTIKITGTERHPAADELLLRLDLRDAVIADIGASDGSTSLDLVNRLPAFRAFVIADRFLHVRAVRLGGRTVFTGPDGDPVLVVGRRVLAWPAQSRVVSTLYRRTLAQALRNQDKAGRDVLLLNPDVRRLLRDDPRVTYRTHDVFQPWTGEQPDVVKIANVLRRLYFSDDDIARALAVVLGDLPDGGHLLIVDNPRAKVRPRGGLYRRDGDHFSLVDQTAEPAEIADLIDRARTPRPSAPSPL